MSADVRKFSEKLCNNLSSFAISIEFFSISACRSSRHARQSVESSLQRNGIRSRRSISRSQNPTRSIQITAGAWREDAPDLLEMVSLDASLVPQLLCSSPQAPLPGQPPLLSAYNSNLLRELMP